MTELENKIHNISGVAANSALNAIENKIPDISCLAKKHFDTKISEIKKKRTDQDHDRCITTPEFKTFTVETFAARLKEANLVTKRFWY